MVIARDNNKQLVYYWFVSAAALSPTSTGQNGLLFVDAITRNRTDGALVRLVTPFYPGESEQAADERLQSFIEVLEPRLESISAYRTVPDV